MFFTTVHQTSESPGYVELRHTTSNTSPYSHIHSRHSHTQTQTQHILTHKLTQTHTNKMHSQIHDAYTQSDLVLKSLKLATEFLALNGTFVSKIFRSRDYNSLLFVLRQLFLRVCVCKPVSSRAVSAEVFVVCLGYRAPSSIDPKLLDPKYVFEVRFTHTHPQTHKKIRVE